VKYSQDKEQADQYKDSALKRIEKEKLTPSPDIYELWYVYYSGQSPEVAKALDILVQNKQKITDERCKELHHRFLSDARNAEMVQKAGTQINTTIKSVTGAVKDVKSATSAYSGKLGGVSEKMSKTSDPKEMKEILESVIGETAVMLEHNHKLEEQLDRSTVVMEELQRDLENVRKEALTDGLTGLSNRKAFDQELRRVAEESKAEELTFALLMLDIDHFKSFNDNFGHQIGDQVLRLVARTLTDGVKGRDIAARYGGEEFAIILPDTPLNAGVTVGNALRKAVETKDVVNRNTGEKLGRITMSVGVAEYLSGEDLTELIERADAALYTAKHNGRNQVAAAPTPSKKARKNQEKREAG
jgi:diguanylate cyclase